MCHGGGKENPEWQSERELILSRQDDKGTEEFKHSQMLGCPERKKQELGTDLLQSHKLGISFLHNKLPVLVSLHVLQAGHVRKSATE